MLKDSFLELVTHWQEKDRECFTLSVLSSLLSTAFVDTKEKLMDKILTP